jgi:hypothetical protein
MSTLKELIAIYKEEGYVGKEATEKAEAELARQRQDEKEKRQERESERNLELARLNGK